MVEKIFSERHYEQWLEDIFFVIGESKIPIIIKPHPMQTKKEISILKKQAKIFQINNFKISNNNSLLLVQKAKLVISRHSSSLLSSLYYNVPTIFFQTLHLYG